MEEGSFSSYSFVQKQACGFLFCFFTGRGLFPPSSGRARHMHNQNLLTLLNFPNLGRKISVFQESIIHNAPWDLEMPRLGKQIQVLTLKRKVSLDYREVLNRPTNNWRDRVHMGLLIDGSKSFTVWTISGKEVTAFPDSLCPSHTPPSLPASCNAIVLDL